MNPPHAKWPRKTGVVRAATLSAPPLPESDEALMAQVVTGDAEAFAQLVIRHLPKAVGVATRYLKRRELAEEAVQEAFTKLWIHAEKWKPPEEMAQQGGRGKFTSWFYRMLVNHCLDILRKREAELTDEIDSMGETDADAAGEMESRDIAQAVQRQIRTLPRQQRIALSLCVFEGYSNAEAAELMGSSVKAVESLLVRARKTLRTTLAELWQIMQEDQDDAG